MLLRRLWCRIFGHVFREPKQRDAVHPTGLYYLMSPEGIQTATRQCVACRQFQQVYRRGWFGFGGPISPMQTERWKPLDEKTNQYIESLS